MSCRVRRSAPARQRHATLDLSMRVDWCACATASFAGSMRKDFHGHPSITPQLEGFGAPKPTPTSAEDPLIQGRMKTFPDMHPSLGSVRNHQGLGCPALVHSQMTSDQWKSSYQAQICERQPTFKKGRCVRALPLCPSRAHACVSRGEDPRSTRRLSVCVCVRACARACAGRARRWCRHSQQRASSWCRRARRWSSPKCAAHSLARPAHGLARAGLGRRRTRSLLPPSRLARRRRH